MKKVNFKAKKEKFYYRKQIENLFIYLKIWWVPVIAQKPQVMKKLFFIKHSQLGVETEMNKM